MTFKVGEKRPESAGRKKGTPNKQTQTLQEIAERNECDPFEVLIWFAKRDYVSLELPEWTDRIGKDGAFVREATISPELQQKSAKDACEYLYPKRKAIEHTGKDGEKLFTYEDYLKNLETQTHGHDKKES